MYTREELNRYHYFEKVLDGHRISDVLDPLTGVVTREHMFAFVNSLIEEEIPFTFGMLDIDNFKNINDSHGHAAGDELLKQFAVLLKENLADFGIAGRFGGDEFLMVDFRHLEYDEKKDFCVGLYEDERLLRRQYRIDDEMIFVTATIGMATYPFNTTDHDELFEMVDKTLYRGKVKGRNCYIIYVESKHRNIEIVKLHNNGLYVTIKNLVRAIDEVDELSLKFKAGFEALKNDLHITNMYYAKEDKKLISVLDDRPVGTIADIEKLMKEEAYATNRIKDIRDICPQTYETLNENQIESLLIVRIESGKKQYGYLMCAEPHSLRIWQESEYAIMFVFARMIGTFISERNRTI
jgi:diguanylate cyclase (GGDEF)-like protein